MTEIERNLGPRANGDLLERLGTPQDGAPRDELRATVALDELAAAAGELAEAGRFVTLCHVDTSSSLVAACAVRGDLVELAAPVPAATHQAYPALSVRVPAAAWAERELRDTTELEPHGLPDGRPLVAPSADDFERRLSGSDVFVMPYGPIRSGVFEAIQFIIETGGEDIPVLDVRTAFKRRDLERRMRGMAVRDGTIVAERVAGISSVAHALAYAGAVERALGVAPPLRAELWRVIHAELERIANHLHSAAQLADTTALHLGLARFSMLKEEVLRLRASLCGSRFGRGVVVPGGISAVPGLGPPEVAAAIDRFERDLRRDRRLLIGTTSFTDRLVGTGHLPRATGERFAAVGPVARGSGISTDARFERPYGAYGRLGWDLVTRTAGDAMARLEVRLAEIGQSIHLIRQAVDRLDRSDAPLAAVVPAAAGEAWGWSEAAQGEVCYRVSVADGRVSHLHVASPSLRNWQVFAECFPRDVLTDFGFIEHSFQLTPAGADR